MVEIAEREIGEDAWKIDLPAFAEIASRGRWKPYRWLDLVLRAIQPEIVKGGARIIVNAPPRHGKSEAFSHWLPTWFLEWFPEKRVILTSYSDTFAAHWGRRVRDELRNNELLQTKISTAKSETSDWETMDGGGMKTAGAQGGVTGRGGSLIVCFPVGTSIETERGRWSIERLVSEKDRPRVLSYNHEKATLEWRKVVATKRSVADELIEIETRSGRRIRATREHLIYDSERGYREARSFVRGDRLVACTQSQKQSVSVVRKRKTRSWSAMSGMLQQGSTCRDSVGVCFLQKEIPTSSLRGREIPSARTGGCILLSRLQQKTPRYQECETLPSMRRAYARKKIVEVLFKGMPSCSAATASCCGLSFMRKAVRSKTTTKEVLHARLRGRGTSKADVGKRKRQLQKRGSLHQGISRTKAFGFGTRQSPMCCLRRARAQEKHATFYQYRTYEFGSASHQRRQARRSDRESGYALHNLSCNTPQIEKDTVCTTRELCTGSIEVYNLEVEENHNYFANGFLVHNCDDPVKDWEEANSPTIRRKIIERFNADVYTRREPGGSIVVIMTRWHEEDLTGYLVNEHADNWQLIALPAIAEVDDVLGRASGAALCPERFDADELLRIKKALGSYMSNGLYQQHPTPPEGGMIKRDWFKMYNISPKFSRIIQSWDLTFTVGTSFVVGQVWGYAHPDYYLVDQFRARVDFPGTLDAIRTMRDKHEGAREIVVERAANGEAAIAMLKNEIVGVVGVRPKGSKEARLAAVSGVIEAGNVYLPEDKPWIGDFIEEIVAFPNAKNDDQVDAMTMALSRLSKRTASNILLPLEGSRQRPTNFAQSSV